MALNSSVCVRVCPNLARKRDLEPLGDVFLHSLCFGGVGLRQVRVGFEVTLLWVKLGQGGLR